MFKKYLHEWPCATKLLERDHKLKDWQKQHLAHIFINICLYSEMKIPTWSLDNLLFMVQKSHIKTQY